jgi:hypothetical protein
MVRNEFALALTRSGFDVLTDGVRTADRIRSTPQATEMAWCIFKTKSMKKSYVPNSTVTFCLPSYLDLSTDTNIVLKIGSSFPLRLAESTGGALFASC